MGHSSFINEKALLMLVARGDEKAFCELFNQYHQQLGNYIYRLTDSMELAKEIVSDVYLKIWMNREALAGVQNFRSYLYTISKNHALNCLKKLARERQLKQKWKENNQRQIANESSLSEYYSLLDEAIDRLPPQQKKAYLLSRHENLKYLEIAENMNISRETVKKYLQLAVISITEYVQKKTEVVLLMPVILNFLFF